ncbi:autotransporter outer membrane beta-barrel domain-containing protein [Pseudomonas sp. LB-090624]|uniref:autotransporter outer membrane beta-barrel domain-containing protein n=1 Tax=Pseudomonas sp. LB-090624 TaxID=2213079 RepID=UPI000D92AFA9|nr:autotransporter outer membrane beta-barrel domain-containing protein [Pseudomonas sp. LB-090624]PYB76662.1 autotransporter outer membrane beta-barrel domain-containing protein [Pseudomonas sp. LB-090624]
MSPRSYRPVAHTTQALAWAVFAPLALALSPLASATTPVSGERVIGPSTPVDDYLLSDGASLTAKDATIDYVVAQSSSTFSMTGGSINATGAHDGVRLMAGSSATVQGGASIKSDLYGIRLLQDGTVGASALVTDSHVQGASGGAYVSSNSALTALRSTFVGDGSRAVVDLFGNGELTAQDSVFTGGGAGIRLFGDAAGGTAQVTLVNSRVQGLTGPAIVVGSDSLPAATVDIVVGPGSTLVGGDDVLLQVAGGSTANMRVDASQLLGDVVAEAGSTANLTLENQASLTGRLENVAGLTLNSQARWNMVEDSQVGSMAMNGGSVRFGEPGQYQRLTLGTLSGNGTFIMDADFANGQTDFLEVGTATGSHTLQVGSSGNEPSQQNSLHLVHAGAGDASFSLLNGSVDLGAFSYELAQRGNDWFLDGSRKVISPGTAASLALFNTAPTVWYGELSTLRTRMGELRMDERKSGGWIRTYGNKYNATPASGAAYSQVQQGVSLGADAPLPLGDGQWMAGVLAGYSSSDLDVARGASAEVKSYYVGLYTTWLDAASGYYFDGVVKFNRFDNSTEVNLSDGQRSDGDFNNHGLGASLEFGRNIPLSDGYFIEPYTQWSVVSIEGASYSLDNGLRVKGGDTRSLLGKAGATVGRNFDLGNGHVAQPYVRLAYAHEFATNNDAKVNDHQFDSDLAGSRGELGVGLAVSLAERWQLHADFDYSNGERIEQPWGANVGLHYSW